MEDSSHGRAAPRIADLLAGLSLASDLGFGLLPGGVLVGLGVQVGLAAEDRVDPLIVEIVTRATGSTRFVEVLDVVELGQLAPVVGGS